MTDYKKEFLKIIHSIAVKHNVYNTFYDFCEITRLAYDWKKTDKGEHKFEVIKSRYTEQEFELFKVAVCHFVNYYEQENRGDFLGEVFGELEISDKKYKGQCFTPFPVSRMCAECTLKSKDYILGLLETKPYLTIADESCGAGCLLLAAIDVLKSWDINFQKHVVFIAGDLDELCVNMCYDQLSIVGASAIVKHGDTLTKETFAKYTTFMYDLNNITSYKDKEIIIPKQDKTDIPKQDNMGQLMLF